MSDTGDDHVELILSKLQLESIIKEVHKQPIISVREQEYLNIDLFTTLGLYESCQRC